VSGSQPGLGAAHASSRSAILDLIRAAGTISRVELTRATGLTAATISTVVRRLIDDGLVLEVGRAESTGGKPRMLLQLDPSARYAIGVHLDHAGITYVLTNLGGSVVARISRPGAGAEKPAVIVARMAAEVAALVDRVGVEPERVLGVGLVSPGPLSSSSGMALTPPSMRQWVDYPLDQELAKATGLPVLLDNDATAAALGEHWAGAIGSTATSAALYMGTGIGAGLIVGGITYRGASGNAGEVGHISVDALGPECWCGARGCVEVLAGPAAVVAAARADQALGRLIGLTGAKRSRRTIAADFAAVSRAARRGEPQALAILERSARYIAVAARTLANIMDLEVLVLTGPSFAIAGSVYLPVVRDELDRGFFARAAHPVDVRLSRSAATAPAIGAAAMVLQSELVPLHEGLRLPDNLSLAESAASPPSSA